MAETPSCLAKDLRVRDDSDWLGDLQAREEGLGYNVKVSALAMTFIVKVKQFLSNHTSLPQLDAIGATCKLLAEPCLFFQFG